MGAWVKAGVIFGGIGALAAVVGLLTTHPWKPSSPSPVVVEVGGSSAPSCGTYSVAGGEDGSARLCIGATNGTLQVSGSTSFQNIPGGCQVTFSFDDDTTQTNLAPHQYPCQGGTDQGFPTLQLDNPTAGDQYQPLLEITPDTQQILGPQLTYGL